ncbi:MAG: aminopeptidase P family protein [Eubacteriales bacterium]|nr:aminopeptidase P family protein [Eubacteriales bacterium]
MIKGRQVFNKISVKGGAAVFFDEVSSYWLTGFYSTDGVVIVDGAATKLCVDSRYVEAARKAKAEGRLADDTEVIPLDKGVIDAMETRINAKTVVFDSSAVTVARLETLKEKLPEFEFVPENNICGEFRMIKTPDELEKIKTAQSITDAAFGYILSYIKEDVTEREIAAELEYFVKKHGADGMAFDTIAVTGSNSSLPHGVPGDGKIVKNSFITMDFGAKYRGYCSDMTRTVVFGKADDEMKNIYATVLKAQVAGIAAAKGNVVGKDIDAVSRDIITEAGYGGNFGHSLGHSLGIEIHEPPNFSPKYDRIIPSGAVMTIEPGIYIEGKYGVRIEDMVYLNDSGCEDLTHSPKNLIEL